MIHFLGDEEESRKPALLRRRNDDYTKFYAVLAIIAVLALLVEPIANLLGGGK